MTKKRVMPKDFASELMPPQITEVSGGIVFQQPAVQIEIDPSPEPNKVPELSAEENEQLFTQTEIKKSRFIENEILYETNNVDRSGWDLTDALIDVSTISSVEKILSDDRFSDFGCDDPEAHELHPEYCCVIFSSAYPLGVILVDMTFDEVVKILITYKG